MEEEKVIAALEDEIFRIKSNVAAGHEGREDPQSFTVYSEGQLYGLEFALRQIRSDPGPG